MLFGMFILVTAHAQKQVELLKADELEGGVINGVKVQKLKGNVQFKHNEALMYCDSAYQYSSKNTIDAWGNVQIVVVAANGIIITGNTLNYNGATSTGVIKGNVILKEGEKVSTSNVLKYKLNPFRLL